MQCTTRIIGSEITKFSGQNPFPSIFLDWFVSTQLTYSKTNSWEVLISSLNQEFSTHAAGEPWYLQLLNHHKQHAQAKTAYAYRKWTLSFPPCPLPKTCHWMTVTTEQILRRRCNIGFERLMYILSYHRHRLLNYLRISRGPGAHPP